MTTVTRSTSRATPAYKDYVNFLGSYKNGNTKDDRSENSDSSVKNFPASASISTSTSASSLSSDVTDFSKSSCVSYDNFLEKSKEKKFHPVQPKLNESNTKKSEIFIEIKPAKSVSEVSRMFETKKVRKSQPKSRSISSKVNIFEKQSPVENKPKIAQKPITPPPKLILQPLSNDTNVDRLKSPPSKVVTKIDFDIKPSPLQHVPKPPPMMSNISNPQSPLLKTETTITNNNNSNIPPPPPPPPMMNSSPTKMQTTLINSVPNPKRTVPAPPTINSPPKMQATLINNPQIKHSVANPNGTTPTTIDKNDPMVKKLVYGTLRELYGSYHGQANNIMSTLPKNRVKKSNGVQDIIEKIASSGDLEKLNGRINPKVEQD